MQQAERFEILKASAVHVGRNHGTFDPLQAPQHQLDVKTAAQLAREYGYNRGRADRCFGRRLTTRLGGDHRAREQCPQGILVSRGRPRGDRYGNAGDPLFSRDEPDTQLHQGGGRMPC